jgi:hypothetical protein
VARHRLIFNQGQAGFRREPVGTRQVPDGVVLDEEGLLVRAVDLDHNILCLAFSLEEKLHVNVWKNRLEEMGLSVGPWLRELKDAVLRGEPDLLFIEAVFLAEDDDRPAAQLQWLYVAPFARLQIGRGRRTLSVAELRLIRACGKQSLPPRAALARHCRCTPAWRAPPYL